MNINLIMRSNKCINSFMQSFRAVEWMDAKTEEHYLWLLLFCLINCSSIIRLSSSQWKMRSTQNSTMLIMYDIALSAKYLTSYSLIGFGVCFVFSSYFVRIFFSQLLNWLLLTKNECFHFIHFSSDFRFVCMCFSFRSMGILLPPVSQVTNTRINLTQHHRNRSLDSALQRIPEVNFHPFPSQQHTHTHNSQLELWFCGC